MDLRKQLKGDKKQMRLFYCEPLKRVVTSSAVIVFWLSSAAFAEPEICYVLDGILFLYGIILTALYCRIKVCMLHVCLTRNIHGQELNVNKYMYIKDVSHVMYTVYGTICNFLFFLFFFFFKGTEPFILSCLMKDKL